jgi:hypothetical protein
LFCGVVRRIINIIINIIPSLNNLAGGVGVAVELGVATGRCWFWSIMTPIHPPPGLLHRGH